MVSQMLQNSATSTFKFKKIYLYSTFYICLQQYTFSFNFNPNYFHSTKIFVKLEPKLISFNNICSTSTKNNFTQQQYLFNFNQNYFHSTRFAQLHSTKIFVQLQPKIISFWQNICATSPKLFSFNNNNYSTSTMHSFGWSWTNIVVEWNYFRLKLNKYFCWMKISWLKLKENAYCCIQV